MRRTLNFSWGALSVASVGLLLLSPPGPVLAHDPP